VAGAAPELHRLPFSSRAGLRGRPLDDRSIGRKAANERRRACTPTGYSAQVRAALLLPILLAGCTCRREQAALDAAPAADVAVDEFVHELSLQRTALIAFGNTTPLPVSEEFNEEVPALRPPLERASGQRPNQPLRMRVARDVPYGQLTRLMQAALGFRVMSWELSFEDAAGVLRKVMVRPPGPTPRGTCWARAWVGPDARVVIGLDLGADTGTGMTGVLVNPTADRVSIDKVLAQARRVDARCKNGEIRLYSQPTARVGPPLDLAFGFSTANPAPHLNEVVLAVPSIGHLDNPDELVK
jgi:hypothetical protein